MVNEVLVSVIIANWNGGEAFLDCLKSLKKLDYKNWELIVIDNGSVDMSQELVFKYQLGCIRLELIRNASNLGFAPANNQGYKISKGKYLLLLNNDTLVEPELLKVLVEKMESAVEVGVIQPKIFIEGKEKVLDNIGSFLTKTGFLQHQGFLATDSSEFQEEKEVFSAKGACLLIRKSVIDKVGLFDDSYGSYFEETDFCWRVWMAGFKVIYYPKIFIQHKLGYSSKKQNQSFVFYHSTKNRLMSLIKNLELKNLILIGGFHLAILLALGFYYLIKFKLDRFWMIIKAFLWNLVHLKAILDKRRIVQNLRKINDKQLFTKIMVPFSLKEMITHFGLVEANFK